MEDIDLGDFKHTKYTAWPQRVHLKLFNGNTFKLPRTLSNIPTRGLLTSNLSRRNWNGDLVEAASRSALRACARVGGRGRREGGAHRGIPRRRGTGETGKSFGFYLLLLILYCFQLFVITQFPIFTLTQQYEKYFANPLNFNLMANFDRFIDARIRPVIYATSHFKGGCRAVRNVKSSNSHIAPYTLLRK